MYKCSNCKELCSTWLALCPHCGKCDTLKELPSSKKTQNKKVYSTIKPNPKRKRIKRVNDNRKSREALYKAERDVRKGTTRYCFFCAKPIKDGLEHHHLLGRIGTSDDGEPLLSCARNIVDAHGGCHTRNIFSYHNTPIHDLPGMPYFKRWIRRIYGINKQMTRLKILHINDARDKEFKKEIKLEDYI